MSGSLPTPKVIGSECRVLLRVPVNLHRARAWQVFWIFGAVVCVSSLLGTYAILSNELAICSRIWIGFQVVWLSHRLIFFYSAQQVDDVKHIITSNIRDENQPLELSLGLLGLAVGVSKHQMLNHGVHRLLRAPNARRFRIGAGRHRGRQSLATRYCQVPHGSWARLSPRCLFTIRVFWLSVSPAWYS